MPLPTFRSWLCWIISLILPVSSFAQALPGKPMGAILHADGGVWINGYEARDSSAVFAGDVIETKAGSSADLTLEGSSVLLAPESVSKFQGDLLELDHGGVSVTTSRAFKVRVNCILVVPVLTDWSQYSVTDINGTVQVAARKLDVNVQHQTASGHSKETPEAQLATSRASVPEGEQRNYSESGICGSTHPTTAGHGVSPKWIAGGAAAIILILLVPHGGDHPKPQISPWAP